MLKRWKNPWINKDQFNNLIKITSQILSQSKEVVFTYQNTGSNWLGVQTATKGMFPENFIILPQSYSNSLLSEKQTIKLIDHMVLEGLELIVFSGLPNYCFDWIRKFHNKGIQTGIIYHGGLAELYNNKAKQDNFKKIKELSEQEIINKIGVVKEGLDSWFKSYTKASVYRVYPTIHMIKEIEKKEFNDNKIHIGIFGNSTYNKNRHTQVVAASMIKNSVIHIMGENEFQYVLSQDRIVHHSELSRESFLELLGKMDINIYCSYSESWGQVILESIALKTPCLFSNNSGLQKFIGNNFLVNEYDNVQSIAEKLEEILSLDSFSITDDKILELKDKFLQSNNSFLKD